MIMAALIILLTLSALIAIQNDPALHQSVRRRLQEVVHSDVGGAELQSDAQPPAQPGAAQPGAAQSDAAQSDAQPPKFDPSSYAYLIIHYHQTGRNLAHELRDIMVSAAQYGFDKPTHFNNGVDGESLPKSNRKQNAFNPKIHEEETGCPYGMDLSPGMIATQGSPNLFCDVNVLAEYLLRNNNMFQEKRGVKIIHLVRNPFIMALNNWMYHVKDNPPMEKWVEKINPCSPIELWHERQSIGDLVQSTLLSSGNGNGDPTSTIMQYSDLAAIQNQCSSLYQQSAESKEWNYHQHLRKLGSFSALILSTTHMLLQGQTGGDILRMASNIIKLRQVQRLEDQIRLSKHVVGQEDKMIQVITISIEEFIQQAKTTTLKVLDFALQDSAPMEVKERLASQYEEEFIDSVIMGSTNDFIAKNQKISDDNGVNIVEKRDTLEGYLKENELFGRVLGNIEQLVDTELQNST